MQAAPTLALSVISAMRCSICPFYTIPAVDAVEKRDLSASWTALSAFSDLAKLIAAMIPRLCEGSALLILIKLEAT